jgi:crotonobetainyl-CoA:carnitine CoA-transferase CaiB-like acyl-CoA transferase
VDRDTVRSAFTGTKILADSGARAWRVARPGDEERKRVSYTPERLGALGHCAAAVGSPSTEGVVQESGGGVS